MKTITTVVLILVAAGIAFWEVFGDHSETGFHCPSVAWLPQTASDISFCRNRGLFSDILIYEFHISKPDFEALARDRNWRVKPTEQQASVIRYTVSLPRGHRLRVPPFEAQASDGLFFSDMRTKGRVTKGVTVLFDDAHSMAYVSKSNL